MNYSETYEKDGKQITVLWREYPIDPDSPANYLVWIPGLHISWQVVTSVPDEESPIYWPGESREQWDSIHEGDIIEEMIESILDQEGIWGQIS